jgi:hypothetical protein
VVADLHSTAGCHPTSTSEIDSYPGGTERYLADLRRLIAEDRGEGGSKRVISVGEIGLGEYGTSSVPRAHHVAVSSFEAMHYPSGCRLLCDVSDRSVLCLLIIRRRVVPRPPNTSQITTGCITLLVRPSSSTSQPCSPWQRSSSSRWSSTRGHPSRMAILLRR